MLVVTRIGVPVLVSGCSSDARSLSGPKYCPADTTCARASATDGSVAIRSITENNASGACGANACHAATACAACAHGHSIEYVDTVETGCVANTKLVAMPKFPPPPPRLAQKRSACWAASHVSSSPSAVTIRSCRTLSAVVPNRRDAYPTPPPSASPATPTVGHEPAGTVTPCCASAA